MTKTYMKYFIMIDMRGHVPNYCPNNNSIYHYPVNITIENIDEITNSVKV